jgi:hypothetical protein
MILLTGWSDKLDGICFLADTDDLATALQMLLAAWNERFTDKMQLVRTEDRDYLLSAECDPSCVDHFEDGTPRREGFAIHALNVECGQVVQGAPW